MLGTFLTRPNRFRMEVELDSGERVQGHCPNPGRMEELFTGGERVSLRPAPPRSRGAPPRVTTHDVLGVLYQGRWVSIDTRLPNTLVGAALSEGAIRELVDYRIKRPEHTRGSSRFDFLLERRADPATAPAPATRVDPCVDIPVQDQPANQPRGQDQPANQPRGQDQARVPARTKARGMTRAGRPPPRSRQALLEVKSCTLVEEGIARFPDAPTLRGTRHLRELAEAVSGGKQSEPHRRRTPEGAAPVDTATEGLAAFALFCIQRDDARLWRPHHEMDPAFAAACLQAASAGVRLMAYGCHFDGARLTLGERVPVDLSRVKG